MAKQSADTQAVKQQRRAVRRTPRQDRRSLVINGVPLPPLSEGANPGTFRFPSARDQQTPGKRERKVNVEIQDLRKQVEDLSATIKQLEDKVLILEKG